jgi:hypothetical protein
MESDVVEYNKDSKPQYDLILGPVTMKEFDIILSFRDKMISIDLQGSSILHMLTA